VLFVGESLLVSSGRFRSAQHQESNEGGELGVLYPRSTSTIDRTSVKKDANSTDSSKVALGYEVASGISIQKAGKDRWAMRI
jgi:hypothetical protein